MRKLLGIQKGDGRIDGLTDGRMDGQRLTDRPTRQGVELRVRN